MKNKKNIIILAVLAVIIALIILGVIYFTTDLFKTEQQLFYKYIAQTKIIDSNFVKQYEIASDRVTSNSNSSLANLDVLTKVKNQETGSIDSQKILSVKSNGLENALLKQSYRDLIFSNNEQNFLTLKYIRDDNTYAITAENILAKYLAVENTNLKDLFYKLGVEDVSSIPNSIPTNFEDILKIDEATLEELKERYGTLIYNNINEENFYKIKNQDKTETIGVSLTEQEVSNLLKIVLETIKNDNTIMNLIVSKSQLLGYTNITIEGIQTELQTNIEEISNNTYSTDKDFIKLLLIKNRKAVVKLNIEINYTEIIRDYESPIEGGFKEIENKINNKLEIDFSEVNRISILMKENEVEFSKVIMSYLYDGNSIGLNTELEFKDGEESNIIKAQYQVSNYQTDNITQNLLININENTEENYEINLSNNITLKQDVQISKLTTENSAKLNDMTSEELSQLFIAIMNRIMTLYGTQINNLTM